MNRVLLHYTHRQIKTWGIITQIVASGLSTCHLSQLILNSRMVIKENEQKFSDSIPERITVRKKNCFCLSRVKLVGKTGDTQLSQVGAAGTLQLSWILSQGLHLFSAAFAVTVMSAVISSWGLLKAFFRLLVLHSTWEPYWQTLGDLVAIKFHGL